MNRTPKLLSETMSDIDRTGAALYQMKVCHHTQMMGYVLRTASGKLFLIDGGTKEETSCFLRLARQAVGCPDDAVLSVDGWFLTHPHYDHVDVFYETIRRYADTVSIRQIYADFPSASYMDRYEPREAHTTHTYEELHPLFADRETIVHTGDTFDFGDVRFDILSEPDETITNNAGNNSSVAVRVSIEGQVLLFLGDMGAEEGDRMTEQIPDDLLRADIVEMAHHGQNGVRLSVYDRIAPKACLWCAPDWLWENNAGKGYGTGPFKTLVTRCYMQDLGVRFHYAEKDGIWEIPLPCTFA